MSWFNRLLVSLKLRRPQPRRQAAIEPPNGWPRPPSRDDDTLPFVRRASAFIPLSQIPTRPKPALPRHLRAVVSRSDNAMGDPWVPPGAYGAAAAQVEGSEAPAPAPMFRAGGGGEFSGGGADASWKTDGDSGCSSGGDSSSDSGSDSGSSGGCGGSD
jgi:hypothetical protein